MEKIYMNSENKKPKKQSFFKKLFNDKGSMTVLVVVAFVGIIGLMVFGLNQISFAANLNGQLPDKFISKQGDENVMKLTGETRSNESVLPVLGFYTDNDIPIFCIEFNVTYAVGKEYTPGEEISDYGLIYLMSQLYPNVPFKDASGNELAENIQIWLTQAAIWSYLYEVGDPNNSNFAEFNDKVKDVWALYDANMEPHVIEASNGGTLFEEFGINTLIANAKQLRTQPLVALTVSKSSDNISITNDNKYYQSDLISVVGTTTSPIISSYEGYAVNLSNVPEGTILVDEKGAVYEDLQNMSPTSKFYVRVPVDKVTDKNKALEISINGNFKMYGGNKYVSGEYQKVANIKIINNIISKPLNVQLDYTPNVPDTGMGVAQTIYFIGLILLLSGVGVVYANAKPKTSE